MTDTDTQVMDPQVEPDVVDGEVVADTATEETSSETPTPKAKASKAPGRSRKAPGKEVAKVEKPKAKAKAPAKPEETSSFTKAQANRLTGKLKGNLRASAEAIMEAYDGRIWIALGYADWQEYLDSELGEYRVKLPAVERKELVRKMTSPKSQGGGAMSTRAAASALGVDQKTIVNDRKDLGMVKVESERADGEAEKVVGQDGVERPAAAPRPPRLVSLADKFTTLVTPVDHNLGELLALTTDERWEDEAAEVGKRHRADLARIANTLGQIFKALPGS